MVAEKNSQEDRLHALSQRLDAVRNRTKSGADTAEGEDARSPVHLAVRVGLDIVAALIVGVLLGLGLDRWLGTTPWGLIVFFILGAGAGAMNVYRIAAGQDMAVGYRSRPSQDRPDSKKDGNKTGKSTK